MRHREGSKQQPGVMSHECTDTGSRKTNTQGDILPYRQADRQADTKTQLQKLLDMIPVNGTVLLLVLMCCGEALSGQLDNFK